MTIFTITGDQLIADPSVGTDSSAGTATVHWGRRLWPGDHRVEITAIHDTGSELTAQSGVIGMRVFDGAGRLVAQYRPMNPGQVAGLQADLSGLGDCHARINASVMTPSPGAPWLGAILITNGAHDFTALPRTFQVGNGAYDIVAAPGHALMAAPCFGPEVPVTLQGAGTVPVRMVRAGDRILTLAGFLPVLWTGHRPATGAGDAPIEVEGELFSPLHRILWHGRWAKARHLAEAGRARHRDDLAGIDYHHLLLPVHSVILTARNRVESLLRSPYALRLWDHDPALRAHAGASSQLDRDEWRRGELLRHERQARAAPCRMMRIDPLAPAGRRHERSGAAHGHVPIL